MKLKSVHFKQAILACGKTTTNVSLVGPHYPGHELEFVPEMDVVRITKGELVSLVPIGNVTVMEPGEAVPAKADKHESKAHEVPPHLAAPIKPDLETVAAEAAISLLSSLPPPPAPLLPDAPAAPAVATVTERKKPGPKPKTA